MTPDHLRKLSWQMFKASIFCGVVGILVLIAVPNPSFTDASDPVVQALASVGFGLLGIALLSNLVSLVTGTVAWFKGTKSCGWVIICTLFLLSPMMVMLASWLNL